MTLFAVTSCDQQVPENTYMQFVGADSGSIVMETPPPGYYPTINSVFNQTNQILEPITSTAIKQEPQSGYSVTTPQGSCSGPLLVDMLNLNQHDNTDLSFYQEYASEMSKTSCSDAFQTSLDPFCGTTEGMMGSQALDLSASNMPAEDFEQVQSLVVNEITKEINYACAVLNISQDPYQWSIDDVQRWIFWTLDHYKLPIVDLEQFHMDGTNLSMLPENEFRFRSPHIGATLYAHLDVWKNACYLREMPSPSEQTYYPMSQSPTHSPHGIPAPVMTYSQSMPSPVMHSPRSISPVGSEASTDSSYSSLPSPPVKHESYESPRCQIQLWQFLRELLNDPSTSGSCIRWLERATGIFKIEDSTTVAKLWGKRKNRPAMNYDKLSRSIRQYYKKGIIKKTVESKRLVYQFCPKYLV